MKTTRNRTKAFLIFAVFALLGAGASAQESSERPLRPSIRVMGEASVTAKPDQAQIDIGVVTQAQTAQVAATQNAQQLDAVLAELRKTLGPEADVKTFSYSLNPIYRYPKEGGDPTITGYSATNVVQVKTNDLAQVGKIIDLAMQSGANKIQSLQFTLKDEQSVRAQALGEAATRARAEAEAIASALGLKIVRVLLAEEGGPPVQPVFVGAALRAQAESATAPTPVEPGTVEVRATVTLTVEIAQ